MDCALMQADYLDELTQRIRYMLGEEIIGLYVYGSNGRRDYVAS